MWVSESAVLGRRCKSKSCREIRLEGWATVRLSGSDVWGTGGCCFALKAVDFRRSKCVLGHSPQVAVRVAPEGLSCPYSVRVQMLTFFARVNLSTWAPGGGGGLYDGAKSPAALPSSRNRTSDLRMSTCFASTVLRSTSWAIEGHIRGRLGPSFLQKCQKPKGFSRFRVQHTLGWL